MYLQEQVMKGKGFVKRLVGCYVTRVSELIVSFEGVILID